MIPEIVQKAATALGVEPIEGNAHFRLPCPICKTPGALVLWARDFGWGMACHAGNASCTLGALSDALHLFPDMKAQPDSAVEAVTKAQTIFGDSAPFDPEGPLGRHFGDLSPEDAAFIRQAPAGPYGDMFMVEGLVDPWQLQRTAAPPILGVVTTHIRVGGDFLPGCKGLPRLTFTGRRRGLACPIGHEFPKAHFAMIGIRASHTHRWMRKSDCRHGLAAPTDESISITFLPALKALYEPTTQVVAA